MNNINISLLFRVVLSFAVASQGCGPKSGHDSAEQVPPPPSDQIEIPAGSDISNINTLFKSMGLSHKRGPRQTGSGIPIAVIDKGFMGFEEARGVTLPSDARLIRGVKKAAQTGHGTEMLRLVKLAATGTQEALPAGTGPTLYGFEANSFSDLELQVQRIIDLGIRYVVYAQVWDTTGNLDGSGIVDAVVQRFLDAGGVWLNSAGNCADSSHHGRVVLSPKSLREITLPGKGNSLWIEHGSLEQGPLPSPFEITLSWNEWTSDINHVTTTDLDLELLDESGRVIGESKAVQGSKDTRHPREIIRANLPPGRYQIKVKLGGSLPLRAQGFKQDSRFWLVGQGDYLRFEGADAGRSVLNPANHPDVLTVTASDVAYASYRSDGLKPNLKSPSIIRYKSGEQVGGSSTAVVIVMGALAAYMSEFGLLDRQEIFDLVASGKITNKTTMGGLEHLDSFPSLYLGP